jgi:leader peptidase (prepilin peptidase)/N-methyltransferase
MNALAPLIVAPFAGSFVGLLAQRLPVRRAVVFGRSECPHCRAVLGPLDLVPLASWLVLGGRCRHCDHALGAFYPAIEIAALAIAAWSMLVVPESLVWASCGLGWALLALAVMDVRHLVLSDTLTLPLIPAGLAVCLVAAPDRIYDHLIGAALGGVVFVAVAVAYRRLRAREGLGLGDAKLMAAAGAWLAWPGLASVVLVAALSALTWILVFAGAGRKTGAHDPIPFGPHLCLAIWLIWLYGPLVPGGIDHAR